MGRPVPRCAKPEILAGRNFVFHSTSFGAGLCSSSTFGLATAVQVLLGLIRALLLGEL